MDSYTIAKSFLMFMAVAVAFSFFFLRVKRLYRLMTAVEGVSANSSWTRFPHVSASCSKMCSGRPTSVAKRCQDLPTPSFFSDFWRFSHTAWN
jgi:hypothetical protein